MTSPPPLPPYLREAYLATDFDVLGSHAITLRVDQPVADLDGWLQLHRTRSATVIGARSPFSQSLPEDEEVRRHQELQAFIDANGLRCLPALGRPRQGPWPPEPSLCVFGLAPEQADEWMRRFGQYAIVVANEGQGCALRWHPDLETRAP